jgi:hypothetical protein
MYQRHAEPVRRNERSEINTVDAEVVVFDCER